MSPDLSPPTTLPVRLAPSVPVVAVQGTLALDLQPRLEPPPPPAAARAAVVPISGRTRSVEAWAHRFAQAVVEIVVGDRPVSQLARWLDREVHADLSRRATLVARAGHHDAGCARLAAPAPRVRSVHTSFVDAATVEASIHVRHGARSRAIAARFELRSGHWVCTALEFA